MCHLFYLLYFVSFKEIKVKRIIKESDFSLVIYDITKYDDIVIVMCYSSGLFVWIFMTKVNFCDLKYTTILGDIH